MASPRICIAIVRYIVNSESGIWSKKHIRKPQHEPYPESRIVQLQYYMPPPQLIHLVAIQNSNIQTFVSPSARICRSLIESHFVIRRPSLAGIDKNRFPDNAINIGQTYLKMLSFLSFGALSFGH